MPQTTYDLPVPIKVGASITPERLFSGTPFKIVQQKLAQVQYKPHFEFFLSGEPPTSITMLTLQGPVIDADYPVSQIEKSYPEDLFQVRYTTRSWSRQTSVVQDVVSQNVLSDEQLLRMAESDDIFLYEIESIMKKLDDHERMEFFKYKGQRVRNPHARP